MSSQTFRLPWPISVNSIWRAYKGRNILAFKARQWAKQAEKELTIQKPKPIAGPVELGLRFSPPTRRAFDLDNRGKMPIDLLVRCGIIEADDSRVVRRIVAELGEGFTGVEITVTPWRAL